MVNTQNKCFIFVRGDVRDVDLDSLVVKLGSEGHSSRAVESKLEGDTQWVKHGSQAEAAADRNVSTTVLSRGLRTKNYCSCQKRGDKTTIVNFRRCEDENKSMDTEPKELTGKRKRNDKVPDKVQDKVENKVKVKTQRSITSFWNRLPGSPSRKRKRAAAESGSAGAASSWYSHCSLVD